MYIDPNLKQAAIAALVESAPERLDSAIKAARTHHQEHPAFDLHVEETLSAEISASLLAQHRAAILEIFNQAGLTGEIADLLAEEVLKQQ